MRFFSLLCGVLVAPVVAAAEVDPPIEIPPAKTEFGGWDWLVGPPASVVGSLVGALPSVGIFWALDQADRPFLGLRIANGFLLAAGFYAGAGAGPWVYGEGRGYDGSWGAAVGGAVGGLLVLGTPMLFFQDHPDPPAWPFILGMIGLYGGATAGYAGSTRRSARGALMPLVSPTPAAKPTIGLQWISTTF